MANKKQTTNEQAFKNLIKALHPFELALLRERVLKIMEMTEQDIKDNPEKWRDGMISPNLYTGIAEQVKQHLGFDQ